MDNCDIKHLSIVFKVFILRDLNSDALKTLQAKEKIKEQKTQKHPQPNHTPHQTNKISFAKPESR